MTKATVLLTLDNSSKMIAALQKIVGPFTVRFLSENTVEMLVEVLNAELANRQEEQPQEQETDYPYIRLWCRYYGFNNDILQSRLSKARKQKMPNSMVYMLGTKPVFLGNLDKPHLVSLVALNNS